MKNIAIFASGNGSNAQNVAEYFAKSGIARVKLILTNKKDAYVLERAVQLGIDSLVFTRDEFYGSDKVLRDLESYGIDFIVLAGFLWIVPENILKKYPGRIVNIHPALLPRHGGKGMYGAKVHQAVIREGDKRTGITIHFVNEHYDEGEVIFRDAFEVTPADTVESIEKKVHALEYRHYPEVIRKVIEKLTERASG